MEFTYRYGTNLNVGYDINDKISIYGIIGTGIIKYKAINESTLNFVKEDKSKFRAKYGFGIGYDISISWKINLEYNIQSLNLNINDGINNKCFKNKIEALNFAIIYKF